MSQHPYRTLPQHCFWRQSVAEPHPSQVDPVVMAKFKLTPIDRVATAGSCFAQNIARYLSRSGFNYFVTESAHPLVPSHYHEKYNYGIFSARFGNIYTSRQLIQLLRRAYGLFTPLDDRWVRADGRVIDPFRPQIQPDGFASLAEFAADRQQHFAAVRQMVEEMDVFVFTLGLTEGWVSRHDGAAYPLCPGVAGGEFDAEHHMFLNLRASEVVADMRDVFAFIRARNRHVRFIVTVSPVPLVATAENRSVLSSTTYSKAALRVACDELDADFADVAYFPSYEIITGNYSRGRYFAADLRSVTEEGVDHVMRLFLAHYTSSDPKVQTEARPSQRAAIEQAARQLVVMQDVAKVICDEEALAR
jgi:GSCFA family